LTTKYHFDGPHGHFRGHADGVLLGGPVAGGLIYPAVFEHNAKNWRALDRDGLAKTFPYYAAQIALYQAHLELLNPALFMAVKRLPAPLSPRAL
jgi:hypothetical protein